MTKTPLFLAPLALFSLSLLPACSGKADDSGGPPADTDTDADSDTDTDADSDTDTDTDTDTAADTYNVSGTAIDFASSSPATEGLCVVAVDPGPALTGGEPTPLGSTTVGAAGAFTLSALTTKPSLGLVIIVQDCAAEGTVYGTGTGVSNATIAALGNGETLSDRTIFSISTTLKDGMVASFAAAGNTWTPDTQGVLMGFVLDNAGSPIGGATVTGAAATSFYLDTDSADGMFTSATTGVNAATDAAAGGVFAIPAAPITTYTATADGHTFDTLTGGSLAGLGLFVAFYAD